MLFKCALNSPQSYSQIAELSRGIVEDYRLEKKEKIQRTFCSASVAANSKVNKVVGNLQNMKL